MKKKTFLKQLLPILLVFVFAGGLGFGQASVCGDADGNRITNVVDALLIAQCGAGAAACAGLAGSDVNCDGAITIVDALLVARYSAGLITSLNCCAPTPTPTRTLTPTPARTPTPPANYTLQCYLEFNPTIYPTERHYPQFSLWVKDKATGKIYSAFITRFAAGKSEVTNNDRPYALPVWFGARKTEKTQVPYPAIDTISGATPLVASTTLSWPLPGELVNKDLEVYLEGNVSIDYNDYYTSATVEYNGQPSLIWLTTMNTRNSPAAIDPPIAGHGADLGADALIHTEGMANITTAQNIFKKVQFKL